MDIVENVPKYHGYANLKFEISKSTTSFNIHYYINFTN